MMDGVYPWWTEQHKASQEEIQAFVSGGDAHGCRNEMEARIPVRDFQEDQ
jgi:hypothetical protein